MVKKQASYTCENCSANHSKWSGRCDACGEWNTIKENKSTSSRSAGTGSALQFESISKVKPSSKNDRYKTGLTDVDEVLGGGFVRGSVCLISGEPGIGKSTLLLQIANNIASSQNVLYISGEESVDQIKLRADRLGVNNPDLHLTVSTDTDDITATIASGNHDFVIVDSIQTVSTAMSTSAPGSVSQITNSSQLLTAAAKQTGTSVIIVGHVTKEGSIAGPKLLEHLVDVVLYLEGERYGGLKMMRSVKNRYGSTNECAIMEMVDVGLKVVDNPSEILLSERQVTDGSVVLASIQGSRPLLVEVQALVNPNAYGYPRRTAAGFELNRLNLLIAMLSRRTKLQLADKDVFVNIVGGIKLDDPGADLAVCMAIGSAAKALKIKEDAVVFGEVGLSGEVRHVGFIDKRVSEAKKLGFNTVIGPKAKSKDVSSVTNIKDALNSWLMT
jgi:DNA repair protein RadA/Sms